MCREFQPIHWTQRQLVFHADHAVAIDLAKHTCGRIRLAAHLIVVYIAKAGRECIRPVAAFHAEDAVIALAVVAAPPCIEMQIPWSYVLLGDDVHHATLGIAAIECRSSSLHNLYTFNTCHQQS